MPDYGHSLRFGTLIEPPTEAPLSVLDLAEETERAGLDLVSLADHPYWPQRLDTLTLLAAIAARTTTVGMLSNLANLPLRGPVTLARFATTMDAISGGRFELGVAGGVQQLWDLIVAEGGPARSAGESIDALAEAVQVIRALWREQEPVTFSGSHYRLDGVAPGPPPAHDLNIWLGAYQPRMLRLVGRLADTWLPSSPALPPEALAQANEMIDEAAEAAERTPDRVRRAYNIAGDFGTDSGFLAGPPRIWAEQLAELTLRDGVSVYLLFRVESALEIARFGHEVAPVVRELVTAERG